MPVNKGFQLAESWRDPLAAHLTAYSMLENAKSWYRQPTLIPSIYRFIASIDLAV